MKRLILLMASFFIIMMASAAETYRYKYIKTIEGDREYVSPYDSGYYYECSFADEWLKFQGAYYKCSSIDNKSNSIYYLWNQETGISKETYIIVDPSKEYLKIYHYNLNGRNSLIIWHRVISPHPDL